MSLLLIVITNNYKMDKFEKASLPQKVLDITGTQEVYVNNKYEVQVRFLENGWTHLSIKALTKQAIHDWREFQEIKNMICGPEREAVELYPAESRLVDSSNQYHLWVMPEGEKLPMGYMDRFIVEGHKKSQGMGSVQRPFKNKPKDAISVEEANKRQKEAMEE